MHADANEDVARDLCLKALEIEPENSDALTVFAAIEEARGLHEIAHDAYVKAVNFSPFDPHKKLNLAMSFKNLGDLEQAFNILSNLADDEPKFAPAHYLITTIKKFTDENDPWISKIESLKIRTAGHKEYYSIACFALGKVYDDLSEWDRAFQNYSEGNALIHRGYDHENESAFFADAIRSHNRQKDKAEAGYDSDKPVFIVGMPRSGSSLIDSKLSLSDQVVGVGERSETFQLFQNFRCAKSEPFSQIGRTYIDQMERFSKTASRMVDKNLFNHALVGFISVILPQSKFIHTRRDPIDTCLSCYFQRFQYGNEFTFSLDDLGARYALYDNIMRHWENEVTILKVDYEAFLNSPSQQLHRLFDHIAIAPPSELEKATEAPVATASAWQVRQPLYKTSVKRWKNYEKHLGPLFESLEKHGFNYDGVG